MEQIHREFFFFFFYERFDYENVSQTLTSSPAGTLNVHAASADDQFALTRDLIQTLCYQPVQAQLISPPAYGET